LGAARRTGGRPGAVGAGRGGPGARARGFFEREGWRLVASISGTELVARRMGREPLAGKPNDSNVQREVGLHGGRAHLSWGDFVSGVTLAGPGRILVVDDDRSVRAEMVAVLRDAGYAVASCGSVLAGVEVARTFRPDLVVVEMRAGGGVAGRR
jgi:hypothetical protein